MTSFEQIGALKTRMGQSIVGQKDVIERLIIGLPANGNLLVDGLPIFANIVLGDEINRVPARVQSAMPERQVTVAGKPHKIEPHFKGWPRRIRWSRKARIHCRTPSWAGS